MKRMFQLNFINFCAEKKNDLSIYDEFHDIIDYAKRNIRLIQYIIYP